MVTVDEIAAAVSRLTPAEREDLSRRFAPTADATDAAGPDERDRQRTADAAAGKLDAMVAAAKADHAAGRTRTVVP
jgi:hypothetical protein